VAIRHIVKPNLQTPSQKAAVFDSTRHTSIGFAPGTTLADIALCGVHFSASFSIRSCEVDMLGTILLVVLILLLIGALPAWPYSRSWGYAPTGGLGLLLVIVILLVLFGHI